ncbi:uracil-DNA glycosylase-like protein [Gigaspora rosea]|uniref:Uracil-DNA glycosylase-like protein n=1 Tax=Gigaspora rosea TaxID=44941 RepID=A0A397TTB4_9GLOM|nr:uracil-DNA glycosylase-like protein [Gigaspora rosea]
MPPIHERAKTNEKFIKRNQNLNKKISSFLWLSSHKQKQFGSKQLGSKQLESVAVDKNHPVPDIIGYSLNVIFVGLFSGKKSVSTGHHFSSPFNHFYDCLFESGLTNGEKVTCFDDERLAKDFKIGIITLLHRPKHRSKDKISMEELILAIPSLKQKVKTYRPKFICFNGMAAYEAFMEHEFRSAMNLKDSQMNVKKKWKFGLQSNIISWDTTNSYSSYKNSRNYADLLDLSNQPASRHTKIFVCMSTSGRIMNDQRDEQIKYFKELMIILNTENDLQIDSEFPNVTMVSDQIMDFNLDIGNQGMKINNFDSLNSVNSVKISFSSDKIEEEIIKLILDFQNEFEINYCTVNPVHYVPYLLNDQNIRNEVDNIVSCDEQERIYWHSKQNDNKELCDQRDFTPPNSFKAIKWYNKP